MSETQVVPYKIRYKMNRKRNKFLFLRVEALLTGEREKERGRERPFHTKRSLTWDSPANQLDNFRRSNKKNVKPLKKCLHENIIAFSKFPEQLLEKQ